MTAIKKRLNLSAAAKIVLVLFLLLLLWLVLNVYLLKSENFFGKNFAAALRLPVAFAGGKVVTVGDYYKRVELAEAVSVSGGLDSAAKEVILEKLIDAEIVKKLLRNEEISISSEELRGYYDYLKKVTFTKMDFKALRISEPKFVDLVVKPEYEEVRLETALASSKTENKGVYQKAQQLLDQLGAGVSFADLAAQHSADTQSGLIGGDIGFVGLNDIVPEIYNQLESATDKKPHLIVSRFGVHIIIVKSKDNKGPNKTARYHVQQIYLKTADFEKWFAKQKKNFTIIKVY